MNDGVVILGGGAAGISAAIHLIRAGIKPIILEARSHLGGRTRSFFDLRTGEEVDNGQHLLMGCYTATREILHIIGSEQLLQVQKSLCVHFLDGQLVSGGFELCCPPLPSPFHLLVGLLSFPIGKFTDRLTIIPSIYRLLTDRKREESKSISQWLQDQGQPREWQERFWNIIALAILNDSPERTSAEIFKHALKAMFHGKRENSSLAFPLTSLNQLLCLPAENYIRQQGGIILTHSAVERIDSICDVQKGDSHPERFMITTADGECITARAIICALPHRQALQVLRSSDLSKNISLLIRQMEALHDSSIINVHLWFNKVVTQLPFAAIIGRSFQWIFNTRMIRIKDSHIPTHLTLVMSGANSFIHLPKEHLLHVALQDLHAVLPESRTASLLHYLIIKERNATIALRPGVNALRPGPETPLHGLFLAGDWTATSLPATVEGAVRSGKRAATLALRSLSGQHG
ncbi:MAG: hydroxysqualene dehydroxylase HpnE [Bacteroidota bacterium]